MSQYFKNPTTFLLTHTHTLLVKTTREVCKLMDKMVCSFFFYLTAFRAVLAAEEEPRSAYIAAQEGKCLHGYAVKRIDCTDEMSCSQACLRHSWCTSSNFRESSGNCELNKHEFLITTDDDTKLTDNTGTTFLNYLILKVS